MTAPIATPKAPKTRGGRRRRAESPSKVCAFRLSPHELALAIRAAKANRQTLSDFLRDALLAGAYDCLEDEGTQVDR